MEFYEGNDIEFKLTGRGKVLLFSKGLYIVNSLKMLYIQCSICHGKVMHALTKPNMGVQFYYGGIKIIVEHISSGMRIISKEDSSGDMFLQNYMFSFLGVAHRHGIQWSEGRIGYIAWEYLYQSEK